MNELEEFARDQAAGLVRLAYLLTGELTEAEDLAQDVLLALRLKWHHVQRAENRAAYVRTMMVNQFMSTARRTKRTVELVGDVADSRYSRAFDDAVADRDLLMRALGDLPARQRTVIVLRYYENLEMAEIAQLLAINRSSVRSNLSRGLASLRRNLYHNERETESRNAIVGE